ncbi:MAG: FtsX-like permease family protein [Clostridiales bacterium]|nr:FtsX-like permease family protein [Clostridiales bacterium]
MYLKILKKDLKRKKTMNIILLIFITLAVTFIASSVRNLLSTSTALESYFNKAELADYIILANNDESINTDICDFLNKNENVDNYKIDSIISFGDNNMKFPNGDELEFTSDTMFLSKLKINQQKFFDENNNEITNINEGEILINTSDMEKNNLKQGDKIIFQGKTFIVKGAFKDAFLGSSMMGVKRLIFSDEDYEYLKKEYDNVEMKMYSINTNDIKGFTEDYNNEGFPIIFSCDKALISNSYIMDMIIAGVLMVLSIFLILISMIILRFTIVFTLQEEFKEIGIMKAIGIKPNDIKLIYTVKYFAISILGAVIGFFLSIPFGNMLLESVSKNLVIEENTNGLLINFICSILVVLVVMLFTYFCSRHINKFTAIDAIRGGNTGESYHSKSIFSLSKLKRTPTILYMAINDILTGIKRFVVLIFIFTLGIILMINLISTGNTLQDESLIKTFNMTESDVFLVSDKEANTILSSKSHTFIESYLSDMNEKLKKENIDADVFTEMAFKLRISHNDKSYTSISMQGIGISADNYDYLEGTAPIYDNEIALSNLVKENIGAEIGDTVSIKQGDNVKNYVVTATYQSMMNMGEGIRFSEKDNIDYNLVTGTMGIQIRFRGNPTEIEKENYFNKIENIFPEYTVYNGEGFLKHMMGDIVSQIDEVKNLLLLITIVINCLVTILMVKSFLIKEKGEIAMLKSIGFKNSSIILWQTTRMGIVMVVSTILGILLANPITKATSGKVFEFMGASQIKFVINPLEAYVIYPILILFFVTVSSFLTTLQIRKITVSETNNIE